MKENLVSPEFEDSSSIARAKNWKFNGLLAGHDSFALVIACVKHKFLVVPLEVFSYELSVTCEGCRTCKINRVRATYVPTLGSYSPMNLLVRNLTIIAGKKFKRNSNVL